MLFRSQHLSGSIGSKLTQEACNINFNGSQGKKEYRQYAYELLIPKFPHWNKERVNEEVDYVLSHSTMHLNRLEWEMKVIYKHFIENK